MTHLKELKLLKNLSSTFYTARISATYEKIRYIRFGILGGKTDSKRENIVIV